MFRKSWLIALMLIVLVGALMLAGCSEDDSNSTANTNDDAQAVAVVEDDNRSAQTINPPQNISPAGYQDQFGVNSGDHLLLDVRTPQEFNSGHIPGAENIAVQELASRLSEVPQGQPVVIYCRSGNRSAQASQILYSAGYGDVYDLGGIIDWQAAGLPIQ